MSQGAKRRAEREVLTGRRVGLAGRCMDKDEKRTDDRQQANAASSAKEEREARLAAALRANLRRRKAAAKPGRAPER